MLRRTLPAVSALLVLAACDSGPSGPQVASVRVDVAVPAVVVGQTAQLTATPLDAGGQPVSGQSVIWSSSSDAVLQVSSTGQATGVTVGTANARAMVAGVTGSRTIEVIPVPVSTIEVNPPQVELVRGSDLLLEVTLRDALGNVLTGRTVLFETSDGSVASVSVAGRIQALRAGTATVTVRSGGAQVQVPVTVLPGDEPVIEGTSTQLLREGDTFEITGVRFAGSASQNLVRLDDEVLVVIEADSVRLRVRMPQLVCLPTGGAELTVEVGGDTSPPFAVSFEAGSEASLAPGEFLRIPASEGACLRLAAGTGASEFLVGIQSVTGTASTVTPVTFRGKVAGMPVTAMAEDLPAPLQALRVPFGEVAIERIERSRTRDRDRLLERHHAAEARLRVEEQELLASRLATGIRGPAAQALAAEGPAAVPSNVQPGDTVQVKVPDRSPGMNSCFDAVDVTAVVRWNGSGSIWLEDVTNPGGGLSGSDYAQLAGQFDSRILPVLVDHFGEPTDLDANGRIVILITQEVNRFGGILGFVSSADLFPASGPNSCPASNEGEFYYSVTPDPDGVITPTSDRPSIQLTVAEFRSLTPQLAAHEAAHIIQLGRRLHLTPGAQEFPTIWELEGGATLAEEVVGFAELGLQPRQNHGFQVAWNPNETEPTTWFRNRFIDLALYYGFQTPEIRTPGAPAACGWLGLDSPAQTISGPCDYSRLPYGVAWSFLRWLLDHRGAAFGGEEELNRRLVMATHGGFPGLEQVLGEPIPPLLARWAASLYADGRLPPGADPSLTFPTWNLRNIDQSLVATARLQPQPRGFGNFTGTQDVAAGSSHYMLVSGPTRPAHALRVRAASGGSLPPHMQLWVVRLQ
jgi:hypothetical protein